MIQWLTSISFKARPRNEGLRSLGFRIEWPQQSFYSWGGDSVTELQLRRWTSQSCPGRESIGISVCCGALVGLELPRGAPLYNSYSAGTQEVGFFASEGGNPTTAVIKAIWNCTSKARADMLLLYTSCFYLIPMKCLCWWIIRTRIGMPSFWISSYLFRFFFSPKIHSYSKILKGKVF